MEFFKSAVLIFFFWEGIIKFVHCWGSVLLHWQVGKPTKTPFTFPYSITQFQTVVELVEINFNQRVRPTSGLIFAIHNPLDESIDSI